VAVIDAREVFRRFQDEILTNSPSVFGQLSAEDIVLEAPFARPGMPRRIVGRTEVVEFVSQHRPAMPVRFDEFRNVVIHETADPEVIVAEYEMVGTVTTTGRQASAPFILVLRVRDGQIVHWREYQDTQAIAAALADT
jgi:hypothetical protein